MSHFLRLYTFIAVGLLATLAITALVGGLGSVRADTSGPNASGYVWIDSNAPAPTVTFDWMDATGGTLVVGFLDVSGSPNEDDGSMTVTLPFTFNFFSTDYTELDIGSNGQISFNTADPDSCNDNHNWDENPIPWDDRNCGSDGWGANPLIAPWFDDLDSSIPANFGCGDVYYDTLGSAPNRQFVVQFDDVCHDACFFTVCAAGEGITFETILFEGSNDIKVQYMDTFFGDGSSDIEEENLGGTATTGLNLDGSTGLQYSWADPVLTDGLAVLYTTRFGVPTNITLDPPTATNEVGSDHTVAATVTDGLGFPVADVEVKFFIDGPSGGGPGTDTTDADGEATFTYTGDGGVGTDTIKACFVDEQEQKRCDTATKEWTPAVLGVVQPPGALPATAGEEPTPTPTPVVLAAALPTAGGTPPAGGSGALTWLAAIAGAIALGVAATAARRWRPSTTISTRVIGSRRGRDTDWTWMRPESAGRLSRRQ